MDGFFKYSNPVMVGKTLKESQNEIWELAEINNLYSEFYEALKRMNYEIAVKQFYEQYFPLRERYSSICENWRGINKKLEIHIPSIINMMGKVDENEDAYSYLKRNHEILCQYMQADEKTRQNYSSEKLSAVDTFKPIFQKYEDDLSIAIEFLQGHWEPFVKDRDRLLNEILDERNSDFPQVEESKVLIEIAYKNNLTHLLLFHTNVYGYFEHSKFLKNIPQVILDDLSAWSENFDLELPVITDRGFSKQEFAEFNYLVKIMQQNKFLHILKDRTGLMTYFN